MSHMAQQKLASVVSDIADGLRSQQSSLTLALVPGVLGP